MSATMPAYATESLLDDYSLEMTAKDLPALADAARLIPRGTRVNVTFLGNESLPMRLAASDALVRHHLVPVPHIAARRLESSAQLEEYLEGLRDHTASRRVFIVAGDPHVPRGPFEDSLDVIATGLLPRFGVAEVSIAGYPEGHPDIADAVLWESLIAKDAALKEQGLTSTILTQFGFDVAPVLAWIDRVRDAGITSEIRVGVPGPAGVRRLLSFAGRFGVSSSVAVARKYGLSLSNLLGTAGPDRFLAALTQGLDPQRHGLVKVHFYTFGGLTATSGWIRDYKEKQ